MRYLFILILFLSGCESDKSLVEITKQQLFTPHKVSIKDPPKITKRYQLTQLDPPIFLEKAMAIANNPSEYPSIFILQENGDIYSGEDIYNLAERDKKVGLGPSFEFRQLAGDKNKNQEWFKQGSIRIFYANNAVKSEQNYALKEEYSPRVNFYCYNESLECNVSVQEGLLCRVQCNKDSHHDCPMKSIWSVREDPAVEINFSSKTGVYGITQNGRLFHFRRDGAKVSEALEINSNLKFRKNLKGNYFLNVNRDALCMQSDELDIYCAEPSPLHRGTRPTPLKPTLEKIVHLDFKVEQIAFSALHQCFLLETGDVYCIGENGCGQITGRHDQEKKFEKPKKVDFLQHPAKAISVYPGGTCVILVNGQVQCFGLGASVIRKRLLPDEEYRHIFSISDGFQAWEFCMGGAENGI